MKIFVTFWHLYLAYYDFGYNQRPLYRYLVSLNACKCYIILENIFLQIVFIVVSITQRRLSEMMVVRLD